ncbi:diguanylate cyclase [Actimicrobium sp. CCI2.3]|uniref:diguanylate cyclase n=1 Tax=Actimicrobium sp. CCI2.3 TaxID=3048616 RepID=UPI002AB3C341|nr:diguanylate cyclase [Actimicrobium sp. CCI2.3]MDY7574242.1 diguanylate cyclase [Actimicrobium sp. CCI2.3]MEB0022758.1 diguanylate cyclase [Actimicrobium sp. CCI2.3]
MSDNEQLDKLEIDRLNRQALSCLASNRQETKRLASLTLAASDRIGYQRGSAHARLNMLSVLFHNGEFEQSEAMCKPLPVLFQSLNDLEGGMTASVCLGAIATRRGDFVRSARHLDNARKLASQIPDSLNKFSLYNRLGIDAISRGDISAGPRNFLLALDIAERFGTASHRVNMLSNLASCQHDLSNDDDAIVLLGEALDIIRHEGLYSQQPLVSGNLAMCLLATDKVQEALQEITPFFDVADIDPADKAFIYSLGAHASILLLKLDDAEVLLNQAQQFALINDDHEEQMHAWLVRGMLDMAAGRTRAALVALENARSLLNTTRNPFYQQQIFKGLASIHAKLGKWQTAYLHLEQYQSHVESSSKSARDSRLLMRHLETEMKNLKVERDSALEKQAAREADNQKLADLNKELTHQIHHVNSLQSSLQEQAFHDHLTGLYNRRHFETCLDAVLHESTGHFSIAIAIVDLDLFKRVNDTYGHPFGDEVLIRFAQLVEANLRGSDMLCRYGGEEFCILLRDADGETAVSKIATIAAEYHALVISHGAHTLTGCTFSAGIAEYPRHGATRNVLLMHADTALYAAKMAGRNRALVALGD